MLGISWLLLLQSDIHRWKLARRGRWRIWRRIIIYL